MSAILRAGVVGAGVFGGHHAAQYAGRTDTTLAAVYDPHPERARALADRFGARPCADLAELLHHVDVVSIAAPAHAHARLALACLEAGKPTYVEKPIATTLEDADAIVEAGRRGGLTVACGLLERAVFQAINLASAPRPPLRIEATRRGLPSPRCLDVSVVLDLMIHDLDLALGLSTGEPLTVEAEGECVSNRLLDEARAEVTFTDGLIAVAAASRVAEEPRRVVRLIYSSGDVEIDFLTHRLVNTTPFAFDADFATTPAGRDRLGASLAAFLAAVRGEVPGPLADARAGARALDLALAVEQAVGV